AYALETCRDFRAVLFRSVHAHPSQDARLFPADQDPAFVGKPPWITVRVAHRDRGHSHRPFSHKSSSVAHRVSLIDPFHKAYMAFQLHGRLQLHDIPLHVGRRIDPVDGDTRSHRVQISLFYTDDARAVGTMLHGDMDPLLRQKGGKLEITIQLRHGGASVRLVRPGKMSKHSLYLQILKIP